MNKKYFTIYIVNMLSMSGLLICLEKNMFILIYARINKQKNPKDVYDVEFNQKASLSYSYLE